MGTAYGGVFLGFSAWAWAWIAVAALGLLATVWIVLRSRRRSSWLRTPEEVDRLARTLQTADAPPEDLAS